MKLTDHLLYIDITQICGIGCSFCMYSDKHKLTKITKHAKRHFWLNDVCTCHGLLPSHSA